MEIHVLEGRRHPVKTLIIVLTLALVACSPPSDEEPADAAHSSRNALDWRGTYVGITPCADCEGIRTTISLMPDGTFARELVYIGKPGGPFHDSGSFVWDDAGTAVTLAPESESAQQYQVGENRLYHLDRAGNRITGALASMYVLEKTLHDPSVEDRRWLLAEVMGRPVERLEGQHEAFVILDSSQSRISGNASCNNFFGGYVILAGNRIRIGDNMGTTRMACPDMQTEAAILKALGDIDNYSVAGERLYLNQARMAPLLVFRLSPEAD